MNKEISGGQDVRILLDTMAEEYNSPLFIANDPVQFPRRFSELQDIEIVALLSAIMAWGNRKMILRDIERLLAEMDNQPYNYLREGMFENFADERNIHRTFFGEHFKHLMRGLREIYRRHGSLDAFAASIGAADDEAPAWKLVGEMQKVMCEANGGVACSRYLPVNLRTTALKRINMALRWLVRDDGIVDMGVWKSIPKSKLYIPLDVHVGNVARELGLIERKANDRTTVNLLTERLRQWRPDDPCLYDYALFGLGVSNPLANYPHRQLPRAQ